MERISKKVIMRMDKLLITLLLSAKGFLSYNDNNWTVYLYPDTNQQIEVKIDKNDPLLKEIISKDGQELYRMFEISITNKCIRKCNGKIIDYSTTLGPHNYL